MCANTLGDLQILRICCFYYLRQKCSVGGRIVSAHNDFFPHRQLHPAKAFFSPLLLIPPKYLMTQIQAKEMQLQQSLSLKIKPCIVPVLLCWGMKPVGWAVWVWHWLLQHKQARSCGASELVGLPVSCRAQFHPGTKSSQGKGQENPLSREFSLLVYLYFDSGCFWKAFVIPVISARSGRGKSSQGTGWCSYSNAC